MFATSSCPPSKEIDGWLGLSLLVDRQSGTCIATSSWETVEAMRGSAERVAPIRDRAALMFDGSARVEEWDIALLHRDHPSRQGACVRATWLKVVPDQLSRSLTSTGWRCCPRWRTWTGSAVPACWSTTPAAAGR